MFPGGDGFLLTRTARDQGVRCPILMLTARGDTTSKVRGLDCGAGFDEHAQAFTHAVRHARRNHRLRNDGSLRHWPPSGYARS